MRIVAAILAAGESRRLGRPKQLISYDGEPLVRRIAETTLESTCDGVGVVVGAHAEETMLALHRLPLEIVANTQWTEGMASSIRAGVEWARARDADAILLTVCDQPRLTTSHLDRLIRAWRATPDVLVASRYGGVLGVPAIFDRRRFPLLAALFGDHGARGILRAARVLVAIDWPDGLFDVDTENDLAR
jgi:CTP:molybdopterin cytidylyltransferase MocA